MGMTGEAHRNTAGVDIERKWRSHFGRFSGCRAAQVPFSIFNASAGELGRFLCQAKEGGTPSLARLFLKNSSEPLKRFAIGCHNSLVERSACRGFCGASIVIYLGLSAR